MARVSFLPDKVAPPVDAKLEELGAVALLASRPIKVRIQPDLYNTDPQRYEAWTGLAWILEVEDIEEGRRFREALGRFMAGFGDPARQARMIKALEGV